MSQETEDNSRWARREQQAAALKENGLAVYMMGHTSFLYKNRPASIPWGNSEKPLQLFLRLLYAGRAGIRRDELLDMLYGRGESVNPGGNLRIILFRLRKILKACRIPAVAAIEVEIRDRGLYSADCKDMPVYIDALDFEETAREGLQSRDYWLMIRACRLYRGEFLPNLTGEKWVSDIAIEYQRLYFDCLRAVAEHLMGLEEYEKLLGLCAKACELYPYEEFQAMKIDCLMGLRRFKDAMAEYDRIVARCSEEGLPMSRQMMRRFQVLSGHVGYQEENLRQIGEYIREKEKGERAMYCGFPSFLDCCRMAERTAGCGGLGYAVLCCTVRDSKGFPMRGQQKEEKAAARSLKEAVGACLERAHIYTCCSFGRYLVLLNGAGEEEAEAVAHKIQEAFYKTKAAWRGTVDCRLLKCQTAQAGGSEKTEE